MVAVTEGNAIGILQLVLVCAVMSERREAYVEQIQKLDEGTQKLLMSAIQTVLDVLPSQGSSVA
jgi:hypothetical protein